MDEYNDHKTMNILYCVFDQNEFYHIFTYETTFNI